MEYLVKCNFPGTDEQDMIITARYEEEPVQEIARRGARAYMHAQGVEFSEVYEVVEDHDSAETSDQPREFIVKFPAQPVLVEVMTAFEFKDRGAAG